MKKLLKPTVDEIIITLFGLVIVVADLLDSAGWEFIVLGGLMMFAGIASYVMRVFLKNQY